MLSDEERQLRQKVRKAMHAEWDPIGIADFGLEMGEYDGYVPQLCRLLRDGAEQQQIFGYLWSVETDSMGLEGSREATELFAKRLIEIGSDS